MSCCDKDHDEGEQNHHHNDQEDAVEGQSQAIKELLKKQKTEKWNAQAKEYKKKYLPLLKFLKSKGLKFKQATFKKGSIEYFRVDHFNALLLQKKDEINSNPTIRTLLQKWDHLFIYYQRIQNQAKLKWPQQLQLSEDKQNIKFASFRFDSAQSSSYMIFLIIGGIIAAVLFPLWPYEVKYGLWILTLYLTLFLVGLILFRLLVYLIFAVFGFSLWVFPRLMDNCPVLQSFHPFHSLSKWEGNIYSVITRLLVLSIFFYYGFHIYHDPSFLKENLNITKTIIEDIHDWGDGKIKGDRGNFSQSALTDINAVMNQTADAFENQEEGQNTTLDENVNIHDDVEQL